MVAKPAKPVGIEMVERLSVDMDREKKTFSDGANHVKSTEEKALVRKIDLYLMPTIWFLYLLAVRRTNSLSQTFKYETWSRSHYLMKEQYMDRSNIGNAKIAGMEDDLNLSDTHYALAVNLFQVSYIIFSVPSNILLARMRPSIYIPIIVSRHNSTH